jgi:hypothetical protein
MRFLFAIASLLLLSGCYTQKQAINKFCKNDTINTFVTLHDTIRTKEISFDTTFIDRDTGITITRDRLVIQYVKKNSIIYLQGKCKGNTIYIEKKVPLKIPVTIPKCPDLHWYEKYWYVFAALALFSLLIFWIKQ